MVESEVQNKQGLKCDWQDNSKETILMKSFFKDMFVCFFRLRSTTVSFISICFFFKNQIKCYVNLNLASSLSSPQGCGFYFQFCNLGPTHRATHSHCLFVSFNLKWLQMSTHIFCCRQPKLFYSARVIWSATTERTVTSIFTLLSVHGFYWITCR